MELDPSGEHFIIDDIDRTVLVLPPSSRSIPVTAAAEFLGRAERHREELTNIDTTEFPAGSRRQQLISKRELGINALNAMIAQFELHVPSVADGADEFLKSLE